MDDKVIVEGIDNNDFAGLIDSSGEYVTVTKISTEDKAMKNDSNVMADDNNDFGEQYNAGRVYRPKYNLTALKNYSVENTYHNRCIKQKSSDAFVDWQIETLVKPEEYKEDTKVNRNDESLRKFFGNCGNTSLGAPFGTFLSLCKNMSQDMDNIGFCVAEIVRDKAKRICKLNYIPAESCRISRYISGVLDSNQSYIVQRIDVKERIFKIFDGTPCNEIEPNTKRPMTEVLFINNYSILDRRYGVPDWFASIPAIVGNSSVAEYNISYFQNSAVPQFAVLVKGGKLDEGTKAEIKNYFKRDLKGQGNQHKTLVLNTSKDGEIKLVPLGTEVKDGSFRLYRRDNRDEIIVSHGIPPHRLQVYDSSSSGTISPGSLHDMDLIYYDTIIIPRQKLFSDVFNYIIAEGFGIHNKVLKFIGFDLQEEKFDAEVEKTQASAFEKFLTSGIYTVDEIRKKLKVKPFSEMAGVSNEVIEWANTPRPVYLIIQSREQQREAQEQESKLQQENQLNQDTKPNEKPVPKDHDEYDYTENNNDKDHGKKEEKK